MYEDMTGMYEFCVVLLVHKFLQCSGVALGNASLPKVNSPNFKSCDERSVYWNSEAYSNFSSACKHLAYDEQICHISNKTQLDCVRRRAVMHDMASCGCHKSGEVYDLAYGCLYVEACAFVDPDLKCDRSYACTVSDDDVINCTAPGLPHYNNTCYRGLIHCPPGGTCDATNVALHYATILRDECGEEYRKVFGPNATVYYVDQVHYANKSWGFGNMTALILGDGDERNPCVLEGINHGAPAGIPQQADWKMILFVLSGLVLLVLLICGIWRLRRYVVRDNKKWDEIIDRSVKYVNGFFDSTEQNAAASTEDLILERADPIPPEGIRLPSPVVEDNPPPSRNNRNIVEPELQYPDDSGFCDYRSRERATCFENSAYDGSSGARFLRARSSDSRNHDTPEVSLTDGSDWTGDYSRLTPGIYDRVVPSGRDRSSTASVTDNVAVDAGFAQRVEMPVGSSQLGPISEAPPLGGSLLLNDDETDPES